MTLLALTPHGSGVVERRALRNSSPRAEAQIREEEEALRAVRSRQVLKGEAQVRAQRE